MQISTTDYFLVRPTAGILFPAVDRLRMYLTKNPGMNAVLDCEHIDKIDFTAAQVLKQSLDYLYANIYTKYIFRMIN